MVVVIRAGAMSWRTSFKQVEMRKESEVAGQISQAIFDGSILIKKVPQPRAQVSNPPAPLQQLHHNMYSFT